MSCFEVIDFAKELVLRILRASPFMRSFLTPGGGGEFYSGFHENVKFPWVCHPPGA